MHAYPIPMTKLEIVNQQNRHRLNLGHLEKLLVFLSGKVRYENPEKKWHEISVVLMDDAAIQEVNETYFKRCKPTDVISFTYEPDPLDDDELSGEILLNIQRAYEEGTRRHHLDYELALYMAHGCLHLTGANDATATERDAMNHTQESWLNDAKKAGLMLSYF